MSITVSAADIIASLGVFVAVLLAWWQLRKANIQNRSQFIIELLSLRTSDQDVLGLLYKIEYQDWKFDEQQFPLSKDEQVLDKLLYFFEQVSILYEIGTITRNDLRLVEYDFLRVFTDEEVQKYFAFLDQTPHGLPTKEADFSTFRKVSDVLIDEFEKSNGKNWRRDGDTLTAQPTSRPS